MKGAPNKKEKDFGDHDRKLYVTGFSQNSTQDSLTAFFKLFAEPTKVIIFLNLENGKPHPKPFAFVIFESA